MGDWTPAMVEARLESAADVFRSLPDVKPQGYFNAWPEYFHSFADQVGQEPRMRRPKPGPRDITQADDALLWLRNLSASGERTGLHDCNCTIHQGEVVGLAGLSGSGQGLFLRLAAALVQPTAGEVEFHGRSLNRRDHRTMRRLGGCFLPANRLEEGLIAGFTLVDHFTLALRCSRREARAAAERAIDKFRIRGTPDSTADSLSGGNQQRLLLSLIPTGANMVLLENPTRGLDVESAGWVWRYLRKHYAGQGAIVFSSAELDEILAVADRVLVFFDGRVVRDLPMDRVDYQDVAAAMTGN